VRFKQLFKTAVIDVMERKIKETAFHHKKKQKLSFVLRQTEYSSFTKVNFVTRE